MTYAESDSVILLVDLLEYGLTAGLPGAIVEILDSAKGVYLVEFFEEGGTGVTIDVVLVHAHQIQKVERGNG
jgi:hypothetical protein